VTRKKIRVEILALVGLALVGAGLSGVLVRPSGEPDHVLRNRFGDVVWNHDLHARMKGLSCGKCHHADGEAGVTNPKPCKECHLLDTSQDALILAGLFDGEAPPPREPGDASPAMDAYHASCKGCHQAVGQGPVGCLDCHSQKFSGDHGVVEWNHLAHSRRMKDLECIDCHHTDINAKTEGEYHSCRYCHQSALSVVDAGAAEVLATGLLDHEDALHSSVSYSAGPGDEVSTRKCAFCHSTENPEDEVKSCRICHPRLEGEADDEDLSNLSLELAIHDRCLECHNKNNPGLKEGMPALCSDCHKPSTSVLTGWKDGGYVLWSHKRHEPRYNQREWKCSSCHHTDVRGGPYLACSYCHPKDPADKNYGLTDKEMPLLGKAYDERCIGCHEEKGAGPMKFTGFTVADVPGQIASEVGGDVVLWDHRLHADGLALSCRECHHNTRMRDGALIICPSAVSCPDDLGVGTFKSCGECHGEVGPVLGGLADGSEAPPLAEAFKKPCIECHQKLSGPALWEDFIVEK